MKIAIVLPPHSRFPVTAPNSIETVVRTFATKSRYRETIRVVCDESNEDTGDIAVIPVGPSGGRWARSRRVVTTLRDWQPDFIELHQHAPTAGMIARAFPSKTTCLYRHNFVRVPTNVFQRLRYNRRYAPFDAHILVSEATRTAFATAFPCYSELSHAIPNAIDFSAWHAPVCDRQPVIAFTGRAAPEKGFGELCAALSLALDTHPDWRAVLVTNEWQAHAQWAEEALRPLAKFGRRVTALRDQPQAIVRKALQCAAIAVVPSYNEPFGLAAIEAHAAGAAVVSSGYGGLREASGDHALYLRSVTPRDIAAALNKLITCPEQRLALAQAGQRFVAEVHGADWRAAQLDDLREKLVAAQSGAADR